MKNAFSSVSTVVAMRFILVPLVISALALAQAQGRSRRELENNQESNYIYPNTWPIDILKREVNYELMNEVDLRLKWTENEDYRNRIRNYVLRELRQCIGGTYYEEENCVLRAKYLYREFVRNLTK